MHKACQCFPKTFKASTVDRIHAVQKGIRRTRPKLSHASAKSTARAPNFATPDDIDVYVAKRYRRTLSHLM